MRRASSNEYTIFLMVFNMTPPYKEKQKEGNLKNILLEHFCLPAVKDMMAQKHSSTSITLAFLPELSGSTWQKICS